MFLQCDVGNVRRQDGIHGGLDSEKPIRTYGNFYCDERKAPRGINGSPRRKCADKPLTVAYSWDDPGVVWSAHHTVLSPRFFSPERLSLKGAVDRIRVISRLQTIMEGWVNTRAGTIFHETYHWDYTVSRPTCDRLPEDYAPIDVYRLTLEHGTETAKLNAESWTQAALAIYAQKTFNLPSPPPP
jgi:hypothetical protein